MLVLRRRGKARAFGDSLAGVGRGRLVHGCGRPYDDERGRQELQVFRARPKSASIRPCVLGGQGAERAAVPARAGRQAGAAQQFLQVNRMSSGGSNPCASHRARGSPCLSDRQLRGR